MKIYPKLVISCPNLENLLEPLYNLAYVIKVSFKELSKVSPLTLSADPKA
jgi:hypothetical protein